MTRKDFIKLAAACKLIARRPERLRVATMLAEICQADNPRFDEKRFFAACGTPELIEKQII